MPKSKIIKFSKKNSDLEHLVSILQQGEVIAAPTETAYGLLASALNKKAVAKIYKIKGRELGKPCPIIISDLKTVQKYFYFSKLELVLAKNFWPGPLTLVLKPRQKTWAKQILNQQGKIGVRVPGSPWLRKLLIAVKLPLTATSANQAGQTTLFFDKAVIRSLKKNGLNFIVVGPKLRNKLTSTVLEVKGSKVVIYRQGAITSRRINSAIRSLV